jgi:hypothetical protein
MPKPDLEALAHRLSGEIRALPMGPARGSPEAEWLNLAWRVVEVAQGKERAQRGSSRAEALRLATQIAKGDRVPVEQLIHVVLRPSEREFRKKLATERGHAAKKKTGAQLDREISDALAKYNAPDDSDDAPFYLTDTREQPLGPQFSTFEAAKRAAMKLVRTGEHRTVEVWHRWNGGRYMQGHATEEGWSDV